MSDRRLESEKLEHRNDRNDYAGNPADEFAHNDYDTAGRRISSSLRIAAKKGDDGFERSAD